MQTDYDIRPFKVGILSYSVKYMKTIKQLWDETPSGEAIKDIYYQKLCQFVEEKTARSIKQIANEIPGLWDMNCLVAIANVDIWVRKQEKLNPNWLQEYKDEQFEKFKNS